MLVGLTSPVHLKDFEGFNEKPMKTNTIWIFQKSSKTNPTKYQKSSSHSSHLLSTEFSIRIKNHAFRHLGRRRVCVCVCFLSDTCDFSTNGPHLNRIFDWNLRMMYFSLIQFIQINWEARQWKRYRNKENSPEMILHIVSKIRFPQHHDVHTYNDKWAFGRRNALNKPTPPNGK